MNFTRRDFLRSSAVGVGLLGTRLKSLAAGVESVDALIIGSGFGGAIAALRLAQAGIKSVVLERGRRWPILLNGDTFSTFDAPDGRSSWLSTTATALDPVPIDKYTGVLELINGNGVSIRNGAGVGGGSLAYNTILLIPRREFFRQVFPANIDYDEMVSVYYPRVRSIIHPSVIPQDVLNSSYYASTRANLQQAQNAGFSTPLVEYGVDFDIVRQEMQNLKRPSAIDGQSWFGLNSGAKNSVDRNYLAMAEATGRTEVLPLHMVMDIQEQRPGNYLVYVNQIDTNGAVIRQKVFATTKLFMGAGSVGTSMLLTKARDKGTLPRLSNFVGQYWGTNGDFIAFRGGVGNFKAGQGGPCGHILMEDLKNTPSPSGLVELVVPKSDAFPGSSLYVGLGLAPPVGFFTYNKVSDNVSVTWPSQLDPRLKDSVAGSQAMVGKLNSANPGSFNAFFTADPGYINSGGPALTAHPVGGAVAGKVCDYYGRVHGHPGLYVVDGAFVPGGSVGGVNPSFTIAALAERSMERIIQRGDEN